MDKYLENIVILEFSTKSRRAATLNDYLDTLGSDEERIEALVSVITDADAWVKAFDKREKFPKEKLSQRDISSDQWKDIIDQNSKIFEAIVQTAFSGLPPADTVISRFFQFWKQYSGDARDVLTSFLLNDIQVPYPTLPPKGVIVGLSQERYESLVKRVFPQSRAIQFMITHPDFTEFSEVSWMILKYLEGIEEFDLRQAFLTACFSALQGVYAKGMDG